MIFWQRDDEGYYELESLTPTMVEAVEQQLGIKLPLSYINLVNEQNGGYINANAYPTDFTSSWAEDHIQVDHILGIGENGILQTDYLIKEWGMPEDIVLISGSGDSWVALDYRQTKVEPPVIYIDNEMNQIEKLADSFEEFMKGLYTHEEVDFTEEEWTIEQAEEIFTGTEADMIHEVLLALQYTDEVNWYVNHLKRLASHENQLVRETVFTVLQDSLEIILDNVDPEDRGIITETIEILSNDHNKELAAAASELKQLNI